MEIIKGIWISRCISTNIFQLKLCECVLRFSLGKWAQRLDPRLNKNLNMPLAQACLVQRFLAQALNLCSYRLASSLLLSLFKKACVHNYPISCEYRIQSANKLAKPYWDGWPVGSSRRFQQLPVLISSEFGIHHGLQCCPIKMRVFH